MSKWIIMPSAGTPKASSLRNYLLLLLILREVLQRKGIDCRTAARFRQENELSRLSGLPASRFINKIRQVEHHRSHIVSAFFASPSLIKQPAFLLTARVILPQPWSAFGAAVMIIKILDSVDFRIPSVSFILLLHNCWASRIMAMSIKWWAWRLMEKESILINWADVVKLTDDVACSN